MTPSEQIFSELNWLSFPKRVKNHTCVVMFKIFNNMEPEYLDSYLKVYMKRMEDLYAQSTKSC